MFSCTDEKYSHLKPGVTEVAAPVPSVYSPVGSKCTSFIWLYCYFIFNLLDLDLGLYKWVVFSVSEEDSSTTSGSSAGMIYIDFVFVFHNAHE